MRRILLSIMFLVCLMTAITQSSWWRLRYEAWIPHQQCLAVKPAPECEHLRPR